MSYVSNVLTVGMIYPAALSKFNRHFRGMNGIMEREFTAARYLV